MALPNRIQFQRLVDAVSALIQHAGAVDASMAADVEQVQPDHRDSARNLIHYLAVRQHDLRELQESLSALGLSSLGRMEAHVMATLRAVQGSLARLAGRDDPAAGEERGGAGFRTGPLLLRDHAERLLGPMPKSRDVRIMVTTPSEAAVDPSVVSGLLAAGMDVMRVNCAHDSPEAWHAMLDHLEQARRDLDLPCRVLIDLAGPKLRTGPLVPGPAVVRVKPERDVYGRVTRRAVIWLTPAGGPEAPDVAVDATLEFEGAGSAALAPGARLALVDARGRRRRLEVTRAAGRSLVVETDRTLYVESGAELAAEGPGDAVTSGPLRIVNVPSLPPSIEVVAGDRLEVVRDPSPQPGGRVMRIGCTLPEVFDSAEPGQPIWFDDGKIGGRIVGNDGERLLVEVTHVPPGGTRLRAGKGINLPETRLDVPAVTDRDVEALRSLAHRVDMVGLSFTRAAGDVLELEEHLHRLGASRLGIVLKIENRQAFERLPRLLLAGMRSPPVGVMVARGDLAVEVGYARLAEIQEEILWMCEAAHVPVIWATQVLEGLATKGVPTRAEVTDAAMSGRAECVMLNKGPHIVTAVEFLSGVLERMRQHQNKKSAMLRRLDVSRMV